MRIAITGTHGTGKTSLIEDFVALNPHYHPIPEPYWELVQQGHVFAAPPSIEEFELQLRNSSKTILQTRLETNIVYDRCPLDLIAYLEVLSSQDGGEWTPSGAMLGQIEDALKTLDLIVFLPIESPDNTGQGAELLHLRRAVHTQLEEILHQDSLGLLEVTPEIVELRGPREERVQKLIRLSAAKTWL